MTKRIRLAAMAALTASLLAPALAQAGAWSQKKGEYYLKIWERTLVGSQAYGVDSLRDVRDTPSYLDLQLNAYFEYGITDYWTLTANATPIGFASADSSTAYMGNIGVGMRRALRVGNAVLSAELQYGVAPPVGEENIFDPSVEPIEYVPNLYIHRFDGIFNFGYSFDPLWTQWSLGFRLQSHSFVDPAFTGFGQIGWKIIGGLIADLHVTLYEPFGPVILINAAGVGQTRYLGFGLGLTYWITDNFGVNAGIEGVFFAKSNAATPAFTVGVEFR